MTPVAHALEAQALLAERNLDLIPVDGFRAAKDRLGLLDNSSAARRQAGSVPFILRDREIER